MSTRQEAGAACRNAEYELRDIYEMFAKVCREAPHGPARTKADKAGRLMIKACIALNEAANAFYEEADKEEQV